MENPNISLAIIYCENSDEKPGLLKKFLNSVEGQYDELIISDSSVVPNPTCLVNQILKKATGNYIITCGDDAVLKVGSLRLLPDPKAVTLGVVNDQRNSMVCELVCIPRWVYEKIGGFDERFESGYCDDDFFMRLKESDIPVKNVPDVMIFHPIGGRTIQSLKGWQEKRERSKKAYIEKWAGEPPMNWATILNA